LICGKFDSRTLKCYFVGYCVYGYQLWCPDSRKIIQGRDVIFDESKFCKEKELDIWEHTGEKEDAYDLNGSGDNESGIEHTDSGGESSSSGNQTVDLRRSQRERKAPGYLQDYVAYAMSAESIMDDVPQTFNDIKGRNYEKQWMDAVKEEMNALMEAKTWTPVKLSPGEERNRHQVGLQNQA
jgi:hypothetical protein